MFEPPHSTPTARTIAAAASRSSWNASSESVICGATVTESPVCTPIGSRFSIEQTAFDVRAQLHLGLGEAAAVPAEREGRAHDRRNRAELAVERGDDARARH